MAEMLFVLTLLVLCSCTCCLQDRVFKMESSDVPATWPTPPSWTHKPQMARYLVHYADWCVVSAFSKELGGIPFGEVQSFSDGTLDHSTGTPYFYIAQISTMMKNIKFNNTVSITVSMAESELCKQKELDPEEPPCSRITLSGKMVPVKGPEQDKAKLYLFSRHPAMKSWPTGHGWTFYKLDLTAVFLLDFYGGAAHISIEDYYNATPKL